MASNDEDNPVPSLEVPGPVAFERASDSVIETGEHRAVSPFAPISSSPLFIGDIAQVAETSRSVASAVPSAYPATVVGRAKNEVPLRTIVMIAGAVVVALVLLSLLLFR